MKIARNLEDSKFNGYFKAFNGMINRFGTKFCFLYSNIGDYSFRECNSNDDLMISLFVQLSNGKFVMHVSENRCFKINDQFNDCDYDNSDLWIDFVLGANGKNEINFVNGNFGYITPKVYIISVVNGIEFQDMIVNIY